MKYRAEKIIHKRPIPSDTNCTLCSCYLKKNDIDKYLSDTILFESNNFFVVPQYHCIIPGYILLSSKRHVTSTASLSQTEFEELKYVIEGIMSFITQRFGLTPIMFEHGSSDSNTIGTTHHHIHFLPTIFPNTNEIIDEYGLRALEKFDDLRTCDTKNDYLFLQNNKGKIYFAENRNTKMLRTLIGKQLGNPDIFCEPLQTYEENIRKTVKMWGNLVLL